MRKVLWKITKKFQVSAEKFIPDAIVFCILLTILIYLVGLLVPGSSPITMLIGWYDKMWAQLAFACQMALLVLFTSACAQAPQVHRLLLKLAGLPSSRVSAILCIMVFGILSGMINWAFSMILVPIFAKEVCRVNKKIHFPLMIAAGYAMMPLSQCICPSAPLPALLASPDHFLVDRIGVLPVTMTSYSPLVLCTFSCVFLTLVIVTLLIKPPAHELISYNGEADVVGDGPITRAVGQKLSIADRMNYTRIIMPILGLAGLFVLVHSVVMNGFINSLTLNFMITAFMVANMFLYQTPLGFMAAMENAIGSATSILIQFPLYGGIMGIMESSGLTTVISTAMASLCNLQSFPPVAFLSAAIVNVFIPSQGGQWLVQGPVLVDAAEQLHANFATMTMAFQQGDECTNLINPLYMLPALAMVKLKLKDVWGFMAFYGIIWIVVALIAFLIFPTLLGVAGAV